MDFAFCLGQISNNKVENINLSRDIPQGSSCAMSYGQTKVWYLAFQLESKIVQKYISNLLRAGSKELQSLRRSNMVGMYFFKFNPATRSITGFLK